MGRRRSFFVWSYASALPLHTRGLLQSVIVALSGVVIDQLACLDDLITVFEKAFPLNFFY